MDPATSLPALVRDMLEADDLSAERDDLVKATGFRAHDFTNSDRESRRRRALVCGVSGQDGSYLARFLLSKNYEVFGSSRDVGSMNRRSLNLLGIDSAIELVSMAPNDFRSVLQTMSRVEPDEIYYLAGQTSVGLSFEQPVETIESVSIGVLNLLEAIRFVGRPVRLYNAGSSECFGDTGSLSANEVTPFRPRSPYAVAKVCAHNLVANYRDAYRMAVCTGILFNHESPLRPERFVTQKVVRAAARIAAGSTETLTLGNLDVHRDWGSAAEYVEVMWLMLQQERLDDYVVATGRSESLEYFVGRAFGHFGLDWRSHVRIDDALIRPADIRHSKADPCFARQALGWQARLDVDDVVTEMCEAEDGKAQGGVVSPCR